MSYFMSGEGRREGGREGGVVPSFLFLLLFFLSPN